MAGAAITAARIPSRAQAWTSLTRSSEQQGAQPLPSGTEAPPSATLGVEASPSPVPGSRSEAGPPALLGTWCGSVSCVSAKRGQSGCPAQPHLSQRRRPSPSQAGATLPSLLALAVGTDCPALPAEDGEGREK